MHVNLFEREYPDDWRPFQAIEYAKRFLTGGISSTYADANAKAAYTAARSVSYVTNAARAAYDIGSKIINNGLKLNRKE